jgi:translation elongation factor EF-G
MPPRVDGIAEFDQPHDSEEITIQLVVSEELAGISMSELQSRRGLVTDMEVQDGNVSVRASLPTSEYGELKKAILAATGGSGRVEVAHRQCV